METSRHGETANAHGFGPLLLTPEQAATSLAICRTKVYELLRSGQLESVRIGSSRRIPSEAIHDYVGRLRRGAPVPRSSDIPSDAPTVLG
jgi:excisionase family DNA binding protein